MSKTNSDLEKALQPLVDLFSSFLGADLSAVPVPPVRDGEELVTIRGDQLNAWRERIEALEKGVERLKSERDAARSLRDATLTQLKDVEAERDDLKNQVKVLSNQLTTNPAHRLQAELSRQHKELIACRNQRDSYKDNYQKQKRICDQLRTAHESAVIDGRTYTAAELKVMKDFYVRNRVSQTDPSTSVLVNGTYYTVAQLGHLLDERVAAVKAADKASKYLTVNGRELPLDMVRQYCALAERIIKQNEIEIDGVVYKIVDIARMGDDLVKKDKTIADLNNVVQAKKDHIERLKVELGARIDQIDTLNGELAKKLSANERAEKIAAQAAARVNGVPMVAGLSYMTTPIGLLPVDTNGMRAVADALAAAQAKLRAIEQVFK